MITPFSEQNMKRSGMKTWDDWIEADVDGFPTIPTVPNMFRCTSSAVSFFPNAIMPLGAGGFPVNLFWPIDKRTTRLDWIYYGVKDWEGDEIPESWAMRRKVYNAIMDEDKQNMAPMQESMEIASPHWHPHQLSRTPHLASP